MAGAGTGSVPCAHRTVPPPSATGEQTSAAAFSEAKAKEIIRRYVEFLDVDRPLYPDHTRMKERVRALTRRSAGRSLAQICKSLRTYLLGWKAYFRLAETPGVFAEIDGWIRHRLRA